MRTMNDPHGGEERITGLPDATLEVRGYVVGDVQFARVGGPVPGIRVERADPCAFIGAALLDLAAAGDLEHMSVDGDVLRIHAVNGEYAYRIGEVIDPLGARVTHRIEPPIDS